MLYYGKHVKLLESMGFERDKRGNIIIEDSEIIKLIEKLVRTLGDNNALQYQMRTYNETLEKLKEYEGDKIFDESKAIAEHDKHFGNRAF